MIITSIRAENILKYANLELNHLPEKGIIAISGRNESGKSTIGEAICFSLFGRTFSLDRNHIKKIIRWGESNCSVTITFFQGNEHYRLSRFLDNDENYSAKLILRDSEIPLANGVHAVDSAIHDLLGYDFDDFISSFYLAQREITAPHPQSNTIKIMAGIAPLEWVKKEFDMDISRDEQGIAIDEKHISEIESNLEDLSFDKTRLRTLRKQYTTDNDILSELRRQYKGLEQTYRRYKETLPVIHATNSLQGITKFTSNLLLLVAIVISGAWILLTHFQDYFHTQWLIRHLAVLLPNWEQHQDQYLEWSLLGILGTFVWFLFFWIMDAIFKRRIHRLEDERITLAVTLRKIYHAIGLYRSIEQRNPTQNRTASSLAVEYPSDDEVQRVAQLIIDNSASAIQIENIVTRTLAWLTTLSNHYEQIVSNLDATVIREEEKLHQVEHLEEMRNKYRASIEEYRHHITVRRMGNELLQGACVRIAQRFNRDVRDLMGMTLPLFTDGRYQYLGIDHDLNVRIFSKEKHDFMDLDEVSSGTQRQTMLALRLALAQQLLERTRGVHQFLFLDEPFSFFDESRTRQSLKVFPKLNNKLSQIWIIAQSFPEDEKSDFSKHIECTQ